jgi:hypothetical protein
LALLLLLPNQFSISLFWGQCIQKYIIGFNELVRGWFLYTKAETIQLNMNNTAILLYYLILLCLYLWLYLKNARYLLGILGACILYYLIKLFS